MKRIPSETKTFEGNVYSLLIRVPLDGGKIKTAQAEKTLELLEVGAASKNQEYLIERKENYFEFWIRRK